MSTPLRALGRHIILELYDCPEELLKHPAEAERFSAAERRRQPVIDPRDPPARAQAAQAAG